PRPEGGAGSRPRGPAPSVIGIRFGINRRNPPASELGTNETHMQQALPYRPRQSSSTDFALSSSWRDGRTGTAPPVTPSIDHLLPTRLASIWHQGLCSSSQFLTGSHAAA